MISTSSEIRRYIKSMNVEISLQRISENNMSMSHAHTTFELYFLIDGNRKLLIQNNFYKMKKGDLLLIAPGVLHKTLDESPSEYKRIVINFPPALINNIIEEKNTYECLIQKEAIIVRNKEVYKIADDEIAVFESIVSEKENKFGEPEILLTSLLYKLIYFLMTGKNILPSTKIFEKNNKNISGILEYINKNYTRPITLAELSTRFYISEFHLCRSFKKFTGRTIVQYINYLRIEKAKQILLESNTSIKEAGKLCGFKTTAHFNHVFKEYEQINPSQFLELRK